MTPPHGSATQVHITIDTECTEERVIRGRPWPALGYDSTIWGEVGITNGFGLPFLVGALRRHGMTGTFFLEPLCSRIFGEEGLTEIVDWLLGHRQDVQLHLHPLFKHDGWLAAGAAAPKDNIGDLPLEVQLALLREGSEMLVRCGVPVDALVAFRAGNYGAGNETLAALATEGFRVDSSLNPSFLGRSCKLDLPGAPNDSFVLDSGVLELPISNVESPRGSLRHLQITAMSLAEMLAALRALRDSGATSITIVTHPREFFYIDHPDPIRGRPNWINIRRFLGLLEWLGAHREEFEVRDIGSVARSPMVDMGARLPSRVGFPAIPVRHSLARLVQQGLKRIDSGGGRLGPLLAEGDVPFAPRHAPGGV